MSTSPPTEYFPGINFNIAFFVAKDQYVTKEYVDNNFLKCVGYAYSRAISTSFSGIIYANAGINTTFIKATGDISANTFTGSGANLTSLNASNISSGILTVARGGTGANSFPAKRILLGDDANPINTTSNLVYDTSTNTLIPINISANGSGLTNLNASNISTGTLAVARGGTGVGSLIDNRLLIGGTTSISQSGNLTWDSSNNILTTSNIAANGSRLTNLNASNVSDGTLSVSRGGTGASTFTLGRLLIGNGTTNITEDPELTWDTSNNTLTVTGTGAITTVSATNIGIGITNPTTSSIEIVRPVITDANLINMRYDSSNGLIIQQSFVAGDFKQIFIQKNSNVDTSALTFYKGNIGIGTTAPAVADKLTISGNTKITGTATIDTNLVVGGYVGIIGTTTMTSGTLLNLDIVKTSTTAGDFINMRYDTTNGLRINQAYVAANDIKQIFIQKNNNVDSNTLTFYKGNIGIGTTAPATTDRLSISGNTKITGTATIDTNLVVGGAAGIVGTGNFTGNVGIGTGTIATNVLQVGAGGRLRIANATTDYSLIGTSDTDATTNTRIVIFGNTHATNAGLIQYVAPTTAGSHIFYTSATQITRMTITSTGVNINNDLGVSGNTGLGVAPSASYKLNVSGSQFINNQLTFSTRYTDVDNFPCNKINLLSGNGYGLGIFTSTLEYFSAFNHRFYTGSTSTSFGTERLFIDNSGIVYINNTNVDNGSIKLYVTGSDSAGNSAKFYHPNLTQGIGISYDGLRAVGSNASQNIVMRPKGSGTFQVEGAMSTNSSCTVTGNCNVGSLTNNGDETIVGALYNQSLVSDNTTKSAVYQYQINIGGAFMIDVTGYLAYNTQSAQNNIHKLVIWDANGNSFFSLIAITAPYPQTLFFMNPLYYTKTVQLNPYFAYNNSGNSFIVVSPNLITNQVYYRIN